MRKAVMFDLDGTLAETAPDIVVAFNKGLREHDHEEVEYAYGRTLVGHGGRDMYNRHFSKLGISTDARYIDSLLAAFFEHYYNESGRRATLYDGVLSLLNKLKGSDCALAVVTNKRLEFTSVTLRRLGITDYFDAVVAGDTLATRKPEPQMLQHAIDLVGSSKEHAVMVGDTANDVVPAVALGIPCFTTSLGYAHGDDLVKLGAVMMSDDFYAIADKIYAHLKI